MRWVLLFGLFSLVFLAACTPAPEFCVNETDQYDKDNCLLNTGLEQNVSAACDQITNGDWQTWCYTDVATNTGDATICDGIAEESTQENCVKNVGISQEDTTLCNAIQGSAAGDECYRTIALNTEDASLCTPVVDTEQKNRCYVKVAEVTNDYVPCTLVTDDDRRRDACIFRTSLRGNATEGCAETVLDEFTNLCYFNHAIKFLDKELCSGVVDETIQRSCRTAVKLEAAKQ